MVNMYFNEIFLFIFLITYYKGRRNYIHGFAYPWVLYTSCLNYKADSPQKWNIFAGKSAVMRLNIGGTLKQTVKPLNLFQSRSDLSCFCEEIMFILDHSSVVLTVKYIIKLFSSDLFIWQQEFVVYVLRRHLISLQKLMLKLKLFVSYGIKFCLVFL